LASDLVNATICLLMSVRQRRARTARSYDPRATRRRPSCPASGSPAWIQRLPHGDEVADLAPLAAHNGLDLNLLEGTAP
jgi:hypothetical protein